MQKVPESDLVPDTDLQPTCCNGTIGDTSFQVTDADLEEFIDFNPMDHLEAPVADEGNDINVLMIMTNFS